MIKGSRNMFLKKPQILVGKVKALICAQGEGMFWLQNFHAQHQAVN